MTKTIKSILLLILMTTALAACTKTPSNQPNDGNSQTNTQLGNILYVGHGCPHCLIVEEYITQNNISQKLSLTIKEVFEDKAGAADFLEKAKICGLDTTNLGVPVLFVSGKCYSGDTDIINYFKANIK